MNFGDALARLKAGGKVARTGWNGKGMWIVLIPGDIRAGNKIMDPCIGMNTAQGTMQPGWLASQADMLAEDWEVCS